MVAYSFKAQFVEPILEGTKRQTIRAHRKRHARPGETMQLYTAMRTKKCRKIMDVTCEKVRPIEIRIMGRTIYHIDIDGADLMDLDNFARKDGFTDIGEMSRFWADTHPRLEHFEGVLITWST